MEKFIGKKVSVRINDRDEKGKVLKNRFKYITGICYFTGYNSFLKVNQITIGRMPIFPVKEKDIRILD